MLKYRRLLIWTGVIALWVLTIGCSMFAGIVLGIHEAEREYTEEIMSINNMVKAVGVYYAKSHEYPRAVEFYYSNNPYMAWAGSGPDYVLFYSGVGGHRIIRVGFLQDGKVSVTRGTKRQMQENTRRQ